MPSVPFASANRLRSLTRAGNVYLTVQDAVALALENNLDVEVARYSPLLAEWAVERADAGGLLRGVTSGNSQVGNVASGQGVAGSQRSAGVSVGGGGTATETGNASVSQIGPVTANLDPVLRDTTVFSHTTTPLSNVVQSQTNSLVDSSRIYNTSLQQGFLTGASAQLSYRDSFLKESTPLDVLNPSSAPRIELSLSQNFLQGFGAGVNGRFIRVAQRHVAISREAFRAQIGDAITIVLNLYWDLSTAAGDLEVKRRNLDVAQRFYEDTSKQIQVGTVARIELVRAQLDAAARQKELLAAQMLVDQRENVLKDVLSRQGTEDPLLADAHIIPLDRVQVPATDDLPPVADLLRQAIARRPDIAVARMGVESAEISASGTKNGLLPTLEGFVNLQNNGLAGAANPQGGIGPNPYFVGGLSTALGQVFRHNFPNNNGGAFLSAYLKNRVAQADYGIDQLQLRQTQLTNQKSLNQLSADLSSQILSLRQARARYRAATEAQSLQEQLLDGEQRKLTLGDSTIYAVVQARRDLATAQSNLLSAEAAYIKNRVALDQALGRTLEVNHISITSNSGTGHVIAN
ncbi:MAG: TolC family protein [Bryobacteraceae bacterium]